MPKAVISTYGNDIKKIISEQQNVPNIQKEVDWGVKKYSNKLKLLKTANKTNMGRE